MNPHNQVTKTEKRTATRPRGGFWDSPSLEQLAKEQNVSPVSDVNALFGTWPGDVDDGFEEAVEEVRHRSTGED